MKVNHICGKIKCFWRKSVSPTETSWNYSKALYVNRARLHQPTTSPSSPGHFGSDGQSDWPWGHGGSMLHLGLIADVKVSVSVMLLVLAWVQGAQPPQQCRTCLIDLLQVSLKAAILREVKNPTAHAQTAMEWKSGELKQKGTKTSDEWGSLCRKSSLPWQPYLTVAIVMATVAKETWFYRQNQFLKKKEKRRKENPETKLSGFLKIGPRSFAPQ